jgi:hypothetical protein
MCCNDNDNAFRQAKVLYVKDRVTNNCFVFMTGTHNFYNEGGLAMSWIPCDSTKGRYLIPLRSIGLYFDFRFAGDDVEVDDELRVNMRNMEKIVEEEGFGSDEEEFQ